MPLNIESASPKITPLPNKVNKSARKARHRSPTSANRAKVDKPQILQWTGHSWLGDIGLLIRLPPRIRDKDNVTESNRENGHLKFIGMTIRGWFRKWKKPTRAVGDKGDDKPFADELLDPMGTDEISGGQKILRRHRLRLSPEGLSISVIRFRWIDIRRVDIRWIDVGEISARGNVIEIFVVPIRQGPHGYTVMRCMKKSYYLEVPADRRSEIESAIRQFMARWKVPLKGKFNVAK